jgi:hypothetical protein
MPVMSKAGKAPTVKRAGVDPYVATLLGKITIGKQELSFRKVKRFSLRAISPIPSISFKPEELRSPSSQQRGKRLSWRWQVLMIFLVKGRLSTNLSA